jgi:ABC-type multidrug transport system ATPase subunit
MSKKDREKRIHEVTAEVGYRKNLNVRPAALSMGEQKLIAFARALLCKPSLLFLDEWTESLDEVAAKRLVELVRKRKQEGCSIIFVSHNMHIVMDLADIVVMVREGRIFLKTTKEQIAEDEELMQNIEKGMAS